MGALTIITALAFAGRDSESLGRRRRGFFAVSAVANSSSRTFNFFAND